METPICVIDAKTFVDHIQHIKLWIYSGHLRLIVPSCTIEQVEQLYQKSIEPKPATQEAPRLRSSGKPPKKEYPAFDINPRVAREYLGRLKTRKEQDADSEQRVFFHDKENHEAVHFQQPNEQYTPWKDLDVEEDKPEAVEGPPTSWAEALRRKQNMANGQLGKSASKAPTKPKLVARAAGSETFPWKVRNDAPKLSAKDVPGALRPFMSCALWRLHESIERNDANQLFLLSDQTEICFVAQKLNIIARLPKEVAATIASKTSRTDLDTFGDLEREFGAQQKSATSATRVAKEVNIENGTSENVNEDLSKDEDAMNNSVSSEGTANTDASSIMHEQDLEQQMFERGEKGSPANGDRGEDKVKEQDHIAETAATLAAESLSKMPAKSTESIRSLVDGSSQQDSQKRLGESVNGFNLDSVKSHGNLANQSISENFVVRSPPQPQSVEPLRPDQEVQTISDNSLFKHTPTHSTSKLQAAQEPEDSDEEVVVFIPQPKRLSAQQKPAQQSSRPSTPKDQSQQKAAGRSPQRSLVKPQSKGKAVRHSPNPSTVGQAHPQPVNSPTVIDPDAFGRDFRVNINPSPRPPPNSNGHSNHRIRGNVQTAPAGQVPRNLPRQHARTSPPRNAPQENSRRLAPIPGPASKDAPNHRRQGSRTSPRRPPAPKAEEMIPADIQSRVPTTTVSPKSQFSESRELDFTEFVPRTAFSTAQLEPNGFQPGAYDPTDSVPRSGLASPQLKPNAPQPRVYEASEFVPRPPRPVREFKPRAPKPKVFEAGEFVPRDFVPKANMPRTQLKQYSPERESIEPRPSINDVDYVLTSGSTRASARGRGRLWTPS